jgi:hypothetical protein
MVHLIGFHDAWAPVAQRPAHAGHHRRSDLQAGGVLQRRRPHLARKCSAARSTHARGRYEPRPQSRALALAVQLAPVTRQITSPTSSATSRERLSGPMTTPTGRPYDTDSSGARKPDRMSLGGPAGRPSAKGTNTTR